MEKIEDLKDKLKLFRFSTEVRVRMPETDVMGIVFHGTFFIYMEVGRMEYLRSLDLSEPGRPIKGFHNLVKKASCEFESPVRFDDLLSIYTRVSDIGWSSFRFEFLMLNQQNSLLAAEQGKSSQVLGFLSKELRQKLKTDSLQSRHRLPKYGSRHRLYKSNDSYHGLYQIILKKDIRSRSDI